MTEQQSISGGGWAESFGADGLPVWAGKESIFNHGAGGGVSRGLVVIGGAVLVLLFVLVPVGSWLADLVGRRSAIAPLFGFWLPFVVFALLVWQGIARFAPWGLSQKWLGDSWRLVAGVDGLAYSKAGAPVWSTRWDDVARVESGSTVEWEGARKYTDTIGRRAVAIPESEMQVFLFTSDGRRLVVHTANAAREDCGQLAHSIRSYVETAKGSPSPSDPSSPDNVPHGFDL